MSREKSGESELAIRVGDGDCDIFPPTLEEQDGIVEHAEVPDPPRRCRLSWGLTAVAPRVEAVQVGSAPQVESDPMCSAAPLEAGLALPASWLGTPLLGGGAEVGGGVDGGLGSPFAGSPAAVANVNCSRGRICNPTPFEDVARKRYDVLGVNPVSVAEC